MDVVTMQYHEYCHTRHHVRRKGSFNIKVEFNMMLKIWYPFISSKSYGDNHKSSFLNAYLTDYTFHVCTS